MPVVFVHGVPDTLRVWDAVISRLDRQDVVRLSLPGFGCPAPDGFSATKEAYVDWLIGQLGALTGAIDIVGHDWGCSHWWQLERPAEVAAELQRHWAAV